jgi:hypothetical protein
MGLLITVVDDQQRIGGGKGRAALVGNRLGFRVVFISRVGDRSIRRDEDVACVSGLVGVSEPLKDSQGSSAASGHSGNTRSF